MQKFYISFLFLLISVISVAQKSNKDTLKTQEITVVKSYTPKISDAFKLKTNPTIENDSVFNKEKINYKINSVPVASTFTPSKGKVKGVKRPPKEQLFNNYISAGFGNYTSPYFDAFINTGDKRYYNFGVFIKHQSSLENIKNTLLNSDYSDTNIETYYQQFERSLNYKISAGVQQQKINYYGLPTNTIFDSNFINSLNEKQIYKTINIGGNLTLKHSFFKSVNAKIQNFSDDYNSNEIRVTVAPKIDLPIATETLSNNFLIDLITSKFKQDYTNTNNLKYSFFNAGFNPNLVVLRKNLVVNLGAKLYYSSNLETKQTSFFAYPKVTVSYKLAEDNLILNGGITGDLIQNSYQNFEKENAFVSPTLNILQTDEQYNGFIGLKGKLNPSLSFNTSVSYNSQKNKPLFIQNQTQTDGTIQITNAYQAGNSFKVIYDDIKTLNFSAEITTEISKELSFSTTISYANYSTTYQQEAWNLPTIKASATANYKNNNWFLNAILYYRGETKDYILPYNNTVGNLVYNKSYLDLNLHGGYIFTNRLTAFAKINNALNQKYYDFTNYQVQGFQILAGITYKFNL
jgi:hypothetical protein